MAHPDDELDNRAMGHPLEEHLLDGHYRLKHLISSGGFGFVFKAWEEVKSRNVREVAVKLIPEEPGDRLPQMPELEFASFFEHRNLIKCLTVGHCFVPIYGNQRAVLYVAMELAEFSLLDVVRRSPLSPERLRRALRHVASGLAFIHSFNAVHRDLKPANVLHRQGVWKVADFGLVRTKPADAEVFAEVAGTRHYMAPEAYDAVATPASDIWSLGVLAVHAGTGMVPFHDSDDSELREAIQTKPPVYDARQLGDLAPLVARCLDKRPDRRPTAAEIVALLTPRAEDAASEILVRPDKGGAISRAIAAAKSGARLLIAPGVYEEAFTIDKELDLVASGQTGDVLIEVPSGQAVRLAGGAPRLKGLTFVCVTETHPSGIVMITGGRPHLEDCVVRTRGRHGITVSGRTEPMLCRVIVQGASETGIAFSDKARAFADSCMTLDCGRTGILVADGADPILKDCVITGSNWRGIFVADAGKGQFLGCRVMRCRRVGVELAARSLATFVACSIAECDRLVDAASQAQSTMIDCTTPSADATRVRLANGHRVKILRGNLVP